MTDDALTAGDVARMRTPLWEQAKTAIAQGRPGEAVALIDRAVEQWSALKDYSINWITSLLTFIGEELGEEAVERALRAMIGLADQPGLDGGRLGDDPRFRDDVAGFYVDSQALLLMGYRGFSKFMRGRAAPEHSLLKLYGSETLQQLLLSAAEWTGPAELDLDVLGPAMWRQGAWITQYLRSFSGTIPGGTSEIQRNIIAERVLGLPRSRR